tara:strand:- start:4467 stop:5315 length:849 start_codon:yes stop_codon:yes gene_type:complete
MPVFKIKSHAKINLSLGILGKLKSKLHKIESVISFIDLHDEIFIQEIKKKKHIVIFYGKFSKTISSKNTITNLLNILDKKNILKNKKYLIKINKNIPLKSGMGGGSMNASSVLRYFLKRNKIRLSKKQILKISNEVGSDVIIGMEKKNSFLNTDEKLFIYNKKIKLYTLIIKPKFGCSTKKIYKNIKNFSQPTLFKKNNKILTINTLANLKNDLEKVAFKKYPILFNIKRDILNLSKVKFARMTGSGSSIIGYFQSKKALLNGAKILRKKYKNYWCILSKTI